MPAESEIAVRGLAALQRAFREVGPEFEKGFRADLAHIAEPVRIDSQLNASEDIRNLGEPWSEMRTGVTRTVVYVAPQQRGRRRNQTRRRPNLAPLLARAMEDALDANAGSIEHDLDQVLGRALKHWERIR